MKIIFSPSKEMREENIFENKKIEFTESPFKDKTNILTNLSNSSPTSISRGWIAFFIFLKMSLKYDIIKSNK